MFVSPLKPVGALVKSWNLLAVLSRGGDSESDGIASSAPSQELWATARYGDFLQFDLQEPRAEDAPRKNCCMESETLFIVSLSLSLFFFCVLLLFFSSPFSL